MCVCVCVCVRERKSESESDSESESERERERERERKALKNLMQRNSKIHVFVWEKPALSLNANETSSGGGQCIIRDYSTMDAYGVWRWSPRWLHHRKGMIIPANLMPEFGECNEMESLREPDKHLCHLLPWIAWQSLALAPTGLCRWQWRGKRTLVLLNYLLWKRFAFKLLDLKKKDSVNYQNDDREKNNNFWLFKP